ncbi:hypothetical protein [Minwuia thermotolerans]|uniref:hypothetical protein n=1 Tax=Minwuia thermotolerans TaxID=2056226 RepID=UPI000D6DC505|nr:hypothetical protein [Minwuia thermotolerans]
MDEAGVSGASERLADPVARSLLLELDQPEDGAFTVKRAGLGAMVVRPGAGRSSGRSILHELLPAMESHVGTFTDHTFLLALDGVRRLYPKAAAGILARLREYLKPHARVLAGARGSLFWISPSLLVVVCTRHGAGRIDRFRADVRRAGVKLLGEEGAESMECYVLQEVAEGRLRFEPLDDAATLAGDVPPPLPLAPRRMSASLASIVRPDACAEIIDQGFDWSGAGRPLIFSPTARAPGDREAEILAFHTVYLPVWDMRNQAIAASAALPAREVHGRLLVGARSIPSSCFEDGMVTDIYLDQLMHVGIGLETLRESGGAGFVSFSVPYAALRSTRRLSRMATAIGRMPEAQRRQLLLTVWDIPPDAPDGRLRDVVQTLRRNCFSMTMAFSGQGGDWRKALNYDVGVVCLQSLATETAGDHAAQFARECRAGRRRSFVGLVDNRDVVHHMLNADIDFISGPALAQPVTRPLPAQVYERDDFLSGRPIV